MPERAINPVDEAVGVRIRLLRKRRKMSQAVLGRALGLTFQQVQIRERHEPDQCRRLHLVATTVKVLITDLFDGASVTSSTSRATKSVAFDPQALRIAEAFVKISDKELRSSLVDVAEAMARKSGSCSQRGRWGSSALRVAICARAVRSTEQIRLCSGSALPDGEGSRRQQGDFRAVSS
jgi:transcriptional regulator with XRE-family HTH domain